MTQFNTHTVLYYPIPDHTVIYCSRLCCTVLYYTLFTALYDIFYDYRFPFPDLECGLPAPIQNGGYYFVNETRHYLSIVRYECKPGYTLVGRAELVCDIDERWNGPPPRCERKCLWNSPSGDSASSFSLVPLPFLMISFQTCFFFLNFR